MAWRADVDVHNVKRADVTLLVPTAAFGEGEAKDTIIHVCKCAESQGVDSKQAKETKYMEPGR